jgi:histone H3/H4
MEGAMAACGESQEMLIVGTKVKNYIRSKGVMSSADVLDALNMAVYKLLDKAVERAQANGRKTVQGRDV